MTEREEALRLWEQVNTDPESGWRWELDMSSEADIGVVMRLIRLARAQPQGEPISLNHPTARAAWAGMQIMQHASPPAQAVPEVMTSIPIPCQAHAHRAQNFVVTAAATVTYCPFCRDEALSTAPKPGGKG